MATLALNSNGGRAIPRCFSARAASEPPRAVWERGQPPRGPRGHEANVNRGSPRASCSNARP
eukprot:4847176-Pyramimonas_sp.AAC.1